MKRFSSVGLLLFSLLFIETAAKAQFNPIVVTGFNQDAVAEAGPSSLATTSMTMDFSNHVMYSSAFRTFAGIGGGGLPDNGVITNGIMNFQLANYTGNNALFVMRNEVRSLSLATPGSYTKLRVLCFSTEANAITANALMNVSVTFTDATTTNYITNYSLPDWFNGATNVVTQGFGRCTRVASGPWGDDGWSTNNPRMYYVEIVLNCTDTHKQVQQLTFSNVTTAGANAPYPNEVIMALAGIDYSQTITTSNTPNDCSGPNGTATVTVTGSTSPYTYSWNTVPVQTGATATGLAPGTYTCTITDANGCTTTQQVTVGFNNNGAVTATATPSSICLGSSVQLSATPTTGIFTTYVWNPGSLSGQTVTVTPSGTQTYMVSASNALGCNATASVTVTVTPPPSNPIVSNITVCSGSSGTLQVQSPAAGVTYYWYDAPSGGTLLQTGTSYTTPPLTVSTTYYIEAQNASGCKSPRQSATANVVPLPAAPTANNVTVCSGSNAILTVSSPQAGTIYEWYDASTGGTLLGTGTSYTINNVTSPVTVYVQAVSGAGCVSATRTAVTANVSPVPIAPSATNVTVCSGTNAVLNVSSPQAGTTYEWYDAPTGGTLLTTGNSYTVTNVTSAVTVYIQSRSGAGCINPTRTAVTADIYAVLPAPVVTATNITSNSITFSWTPISGATSYQVSVNGGAYQIPSSGATGTSHTVTGLGPVQTVSIVVKAFGNPSCTDGPPSVVVSATTKGTLDVFVPNVFTPNNDGKNDILKVYGNFISSIQLRIFNQWGELIFVSNDKNIGWDGSYKGLMQPVGVYAYTLVAVLIDGTTVKKQGAINLLR